MSGDLVRDLPPRIRREIVEGLQAYSEAMTRAQGYMIDGKLTECADEMFVAAGKLIKVMKILRRADK